MGALELFGIVVAVVIAAAIALLAVPIDLRGSAAGENAFSWKLDLRWLFGLVCIERRGEHPVSARARRDAASSRDAAPVRVEKAGKGGVPSFVTEPIVWRRGARALRSTSRGVRFRRFDGRLRLGLGDPADTGRVFGVLLPAMLFVLPANLAVVPDFERAVLAGRVSGELRIVPLAVVAPLASFAIWLALHARRARGRRR